MDYKELVNYITDRDTCDGTCIFHDICPVSPSALLKELCLIKRDLTFDVFYNLYVSPKQGIDNEIKGALYKMSQDAATSGDNKEYLNQLVKVKSAFYGPDKGKDVEEITEVNIDIVPVTPQSTSTKTKKTARKGKKE
mgnify:CR=1 FL=1